MQSTEAISAPIAMNVSSCNRSAWPRDAPWHSSAARRAPRFTAPFPPALSETWRPSPDPGVRMHEGRRVARATRRRCPARAPRAGPCRIASVANPPRALTVQSPRARPTAGLVLSSMRGAVVAASRVCELRLSRVVPLGTADGELRTITTQTNGGRRTVHHAALRVVLKERTKP